MKIVATVTNCNEVIVAGGSPESRSVIIDLGDNLPFLLREYLRRKKEAKEKQGMINCESLHFSILGDET